LLSATDLSTAANVGISRRAVNELSSFRDAFRQFFSRLLAKWPKEAKNITNHIFHPASLSSNAHNNALILARKSQRLV